jgi:transposase
MQEELFTQALGLSSPWRVSAVDFQREQGQITFRIVNEAKRLPCPACGAAEQPVHDRRERRWRHLNFFQYKALLEASVPRVACTVCGKTSQVSVPWARAGSGFTQVLEAFIVALCEQMPASAVADLLGVSDDRVWRVLEHYVDTARAKEDYGAVRRISADERSSRKGQRYLTLFCDIDKRRVLYATPGRDRTTFEAFAEDLAAHGGDAKAITDISLDLGKAYQAGARDQCPQAKISFDPFHVVALAHTALDQVRRAEAKQEPDLKGIRWGTLKDAHRWSSAQITDMHWLQRSGLKTARAWRLKERLREIFASARNAASAAPLLKAWISWARRCRLAPFKRLGATVKAHLEGILAHFETGLNNGMAEAINGRIQAAKNKARGYATDRHLTVMCYLICGKLRHLPANPWLQPQRCEA